MSDIKFENPYKGRTAGMDFYQDKIRSYLGKLGVDPEKDISFTTGAVSYVSFVMDGKPFHVEQPMAYFRKDNKNKKSPEKASVSQAWALLQEYICSLATRAMINSLSEGVAPWQYFTPHLQLANGDTMEKGAVAMVNSKSEKLLLAEVN